MTKEKITKERGKEIQKKHTNELYERRVGENKQE